VTASDGPRDSVGPHANSKNAQSGSKYGKTRGFMALPL
jgi:hypothetical protein